jgi:uncharacterized protein
MAMTNATERASRVLGLFAKRPTPGEVKTRLAAATSPDWAAAVASAFLHDSIDRLAAVDARRVLAYAPDDAEAYFAALAGDRFRLVPQGEGDLGRRMGAFFEDQLRGGAVAVVLVGTDSPTLPLAYVEQAFRELDGADVVLGPATDGGYYLIGCARRQPLFADIPWSSPHVLSETIARLTNLKSRLALLPPWYDIDTLTDWWVLRGHLAAMGRSGIDPGLPRTSAIGPPPS